MTQADPAAYDWLFDGDLAGLGEAACLTVAVGATREQLAEAFGVDLTAPPVGPEVPAGPELVSFVEVGGQQVAVEAAGAGGTTAEVLGALAAHGRAASASWSAEDLVRFVCAADGTVLYDGEFVYDGTDGLPRELVPLVELVADDLEGDLSLEEEPVDDPPLDIAVGMALVETYTGVRVTADDVRRALAQRHHRAVAPDED